MLLFVLTNSVPPIMLLVLAVTLYLVWVDVKDEPVDFQVKAWWFLLVLILHVVGYLFFRAWLALRRRDRNGDEHTPTPGPRGRRGGGRA